MKVLKSSIVMLLPILVFSTVVMAAESPESSELAGTPLSWWIAPIAALLALGFAYYFYKKVMEAPEGTDKMKEIAHRNNVSPDFLLNDPKSRFIIGIFYLNSMFFALYDETLKEDSVILKHLSD